MDLAIYSVTLIAVFAITRYMTEKIKFHVRFSGYWLHHWIMGAIVMLAVYFLGYDEPWLWGSLTGICLEGLRRKNWSFVDVGTNSN